MRKPSEKKWKTKWGRKEEKWENNVRKEIENKIQKVREESAKRKGEKYAKKT